MKYTDVLSFFVFNNRLKDYGQALAHAIEKGYRIGGILDFLRYDGEEPFLALRHDVDQLNVGVREMHEEEQKLGVNSTWYFRWCSVERKSMAALAEAGSEVALHYETLGELCEARGIETRADLTKGIVEEARARLIDEVQRFRREFQLPCLTIAAHGHPYNRLIKVANNEIVDSKLMDEMGVLAEAYDEQILSRLDCYLSDMYPRTNYGWAYRKTLREAIDEGNKQICFLSHPEHWRFSPGQRIRGGLELLTRGVKVREREFRAVFGEIDLQNLLK